MMQQCKESSCSYLSGSGLAFQRAALQTICSSPVNLWYISVLAFECHQLKGENAMKTDSDSMTNFSDRQAEVI
jgi:hypothetical protein